MATNPPVPSEVLDAANSSTPALPTGTVASTPSTDSGNTVSSSSAPAHSGMDLGSILSQIAGNNSNIKNNVIPAIQADYGQVATAGNEMVNALTQKGQDESMVENTKELGLLRAQENSRQVATALGTNLDDASQILTQLGTTMINEYQASTQAKAQVDQLNQTSFFDDPLGWISAKMNLPQANAVYNSHAQAFNSAESTMSGIIALTDADTKMQNDIAAQKSAASVQAQSDAVTQDAIINSAKVQQSNALYNIQGIDAVQKMNSEQLNNSVTGLSAIVSSGHLQIAQQQLALTTTAQAGEIEERAQRIQLNQMTMDDLNSTAETTNAGRASMGLPPLPPTKIIQMLKMGGPVGQSIKDAYIAGGTSQAVGKSVISDNVGDAARVITQSQAPLTTVQSGIKSTLQDTYAGTAGGQLDKRIDPKNAAQVEASVTANLNQRFAMQRSSITPEDGTNIYQPPDLKSLSTLPSVDSTQLYQKILGPAIQSGMTKFDPETISAMAVAGIRNGSIDLNTATKDLVTISNAAVQLNNVTKDYTKFGIAPQTDLNMKVADPVSGFSKIIPMNNPAAVSNYLSRQLIPQSAAFDMAVSMAKTNSVFGGK